MVKWFFLFILTITNAFAFECKSINDIQSALLPRLNTTNNIIQMLPKNNEIKIAIIDTGLNVGIKELRNHVDFNEKTIGFGYNVAENSFLPFDSDYGHGSNVAGIILAINPNAKIIPIKFYNKKASDETNTLNFIKALKKAIELKVNIINISGGGAEPFPAEKELIKEAEQKGIFVISAAGNEGQNLSNQPYYPASYKLSNIFTVMNNDDHNKKHSSSNFGSIVDISTIGTQVFSFSTNKDCSKALTGTSQATPIVSGLISLMLSYNNNLSFNEVRSLLINNSNKLPTMKGVNKANGTLNITKTLTATFEYTAKIPLILSQAN